MTNLQRYAPRAQTVRDAERWVRSLLPRSAPPSVMPGVLAGLALVLVGAAAALALAPMNGAEMRAMTRKRLDGLRRKASDFAANHDPRGARNGRAAQSQSERSRRAEATS